MFFWVIGRYMKHLVSGKVRLCIFSEMLISIWISRIWTSRFSGILELRSRSPKPSFGVPDPRTQETPELGFGTPKPGNGTPDPGTPKLGSRTPKPRNWGPRPPKPRKRQFSPRNRKPTFLGKNASFGVWGSGPKKGGSWDPVSGPSFGVPGIP